MVKQVETQQNLPLALYSITQLLPHRLTAQMPKGELGGSTSTTMAAVASFLSSGNTGKDAIMDCAQHPVPVVDRYFSVAPKSRGIVSDI